MWISIPMISYRVSIQGNYGLRLTARAADASELLCLEVDFELAMPESLDGRGESSSLEGFRMKEIMKGTGGQRRNEA